MLSVEQFFERLPELQRYTEGKRALAGEGPMQARVIDVDGFRARVRQLMEDEVGLDTIAIAQRVNQHMGLLGADQDYLEIMLHSLGEEVAGYYDHREKIFYILDSKTTNFATPIVHHEIVHALQDARWSIGPLMRPGYTASDITAARGALIEGDATLLMMTCGYGLSPQTTDAAAYQAMAQAIASQMEHAFFEETAIPHFLAHSMIASYAQGLRFASALFYHEARGWDGVNAAFEHLPLSTEQIVEPERYWSADEPTFVVTRLDPTLLGERKYLDIVGVLGIRGAFQHLAKNSQTPGTTHPQRVNAYVRGWDGDRLEYWESETHDTIVWTLVFDSTEEARAFVALARDFIPTWLETPELPLASLTEAAGAFGQRVGAATATHGVGVERWGDAVSLVIRVARPQAMASEASLRQETVALLAQALRTHERYRYPEIFRAHPKDVPGLSPHAVD